MKSQIATELLTIAVIGIIITTTLFYLTLYHSSQSASQVLATSAVNTIANSADYLYSIGNQSSITLTLKFPEGIVNTSIVNKTIILKLSTSAGITDIFAVTKANLAGLLPNVSGIYRIKLQNIDNLIKISW